jgi:hypothetical protein
MTEWKLIRVNKDMHQELSKLGEYGDSMGDIMRKLLDSYYNRNPNAKRDNERELKTFSKALHSKVEKIEGKGRKKRL